MLLLIDTQRENNYKAMEKFATLLLEIAREDDDSTYRFSAYVTLGRAAESQNKIPQAITYLLETDSLPDLLTRNQYVGKKILFELYTKTGDVLKAQEYFNEAHSMFKKLSKEDWEKILKEANILLHEAMINAAVFRNTGKLAIEMIVECKKEDKEQKKLHVPPNMVNDQK